MTTIRDLIDGLHRIADSIVGLTALLERIWPDILAVLDVIKQQGGKS